jgi:DNA-binding XRE family transcriptional regulator
MKIAKPIEWVTNEKGCQLVTSINPNRDGYIKVTRGGKGWWLHRYVYTQNFGEIPKGLVILHTCDEPSCMNIEHLRAGTQQDNLKDMLEKGRHQTKPSRFDTITPKKIRELRLEKGLSCNKLAKLSKVSNSYLSRIENHEFNGSVEVLNRIATALEVNFIELFK